MPTKVYDAIIIHTGEDSTINFPRESFVFKDIKAAFKDQAKVTVEIKLRRKPRSLNQNSFYFGYFIQYEIDCFKEFWGEEYDKKTMHEWNKQQFFGEERVSELTGEIIRVPGSSADQGTIEFEEKLELIRQWFRMNFDFEIPYPLEQEKLNFKQ